VSLRGPPHLAVPRRPQPRRPASDLGGLRRRPARLGRPRAVHRRTGVKSWEALSGESVTELLPGQTHPAVGLSPDGPALRPRGDMRPRERPGAGWYGWLVHRCLG